MRTSSPHPGCFYLYDIPGGAPLLCSQHERVFMCEFPSGLHRYLTRAAYTSLHHPSTVAIINNGAVGGVVMARNVTGSSHVRRMRTRLNDLSREEETQPMNPYEDPIAIPPPPLDTAAPRRGRRWLVPGLLALAFTLTLVMGIFVGATMLRTAQAAANTPDGADFAQFSLANTPGAHGPGSNGSSGQGQCDAYTVSSVSGQTITAKAADGSTVTIHTSSSTKYTKGGQSATASAVTAGSHIFVMGAKNSDGSINATQIDVR